MSTVGLYLFGELANSSSIEWIRVRSQAKPANQGHPHASRNTERVEEGKGREKPIRVLLQVKVGPNAVDICQDLSMGQLHTLRITGGAGTEDQAGNVVWRGLYQGWQPA